MSESIDYDLQPSFDVGNIMEIIEDAPDVMDVIVRCKNCGQGVRYGDTRMVSGFVGCESKLGGASVYSDSDEPSTCYWGDLMPRVLWLREHDYERYLEGKVYRFRDGADGGMSALRGDEG